MMENVLNDIVDYISDTSTDRYDKVMANKWLISIEELVAQVENRNKEIERRISTTNYHKINELIQANNRDSKSIGEYLLLIRQAQIKTMGQEEQKEEVE